MKPVNLPDLDRASLPAQSAPGALASTLGASLDRSLMRAATVLVERRVLPRAADLEGLRSSVQFMLESDALNDPARFFDFVAQLEAGHRQRVYPVDSLKRQHLPGGAVYRRRLVSDYHQAPAPAWLVAQGQHSDPIQFEHWQHKPGAALGTVVLLHGFAMGWPGIDARLMAARYWFRQGLNVVVLILPDHGPRRASDTLLSGLRFTVPHALRLAGAVRQAVYEIFALKQWLRSVDSAPVGLVGMSLGGYLASLCAGLSNDFEFIVPLVPPACMGDLAWRVYRETAQHRVGKDRVLTRQNMRTAFFLHSPLAHARQVPTERIMLVAGAGDRIVPPEHPTALWEHWGRPRIHWLSGSHIATASSAALRKPVREHLSSLGIL